MAAQRSRRRRAGAHPVSAPGSGSPANPDHAGPNAARTAADSPAADPGDDLLECLRTGDQQRFERVVTAWTPAMLRLAGTYLPSRAAAEDAVQETWVTVLSGLDRFRGESHVKTYVFGILVNHARRQGAKQRRTLPFSAAAREESAPAVDPARFYGPGFPDRAGGWRLPPRRWDLEPEERLSAAELRGVIEREIAALPSRQRLVITARDVLGMPAGEVSGILGLSDGNQRVLLHRARSRVRAALEHYADSTDSSNEESR